MRWAFVSIVVVAAVVGAGTADARPINCSPAAVKSVVRQIKPHIPSLGDTPLLVTPGMVDQVICFASHNAVAVSVASGGTAGDIGWFVLARPGSRWRLELGRTGYKIGLFRVGVDLVVSQPIYRKNDPNCCPTGGFEHERLHWSG